MAINRGTTSAGARTLPFDADEPTSRALLARLVKTNEIWTAAIEGRELPAGDDDSVTGLQRRHESAGPGLLDIMRGVAERGEWDSAFVDALCDPPESFTFGGCLAHVLTFSAYRRTALIAALHEAGVEDVGYGDQMEWERLLADGQA